MKNAYKSLLLFFPVLILTGCFTSIKMPISDSEVNTIDSNSAIVIIGKYAKSEILKIKIDNNGTEAIYPMKTTPPAVNAVVYKFKIGSTIRITEVTADMSALESGNYGRGYLGHKANIKKARTLKITKRGIYNLGTILTKGKKIRVIDKMPKQVLVIAKRNYPNIFNALKPVNYK